MIRFDLLTDDNLLDIFDFYVISTSEEGTKAGIEAWQSLVQVCRQWRSLVFGSPRHLDLRLFCTPKTPVRDALDTWPALPLIVNGETNLASGIDNVIAALGHSNRVCQLTLRDLKDRQLEQILAVTRVPFPELTDLSLSSANETLVIPDSFLGRSAPRLRSFDLSCIPCPGLPKLLLSANHLNSLLLLRIPRSGYISPEAMVALLSTLCSLETLSLEFLYPPSRPDWETRSPPPPERSILPVLTNIFFQGATEYLEDFVTMIDSPQLDFFEISFFDQINYDTQRLAQFINRTVPKHIRHNKAHVEFVEWATRVEFGLYEIYIPCKESDRQLSSVAQVFNPFLPLTVEDLYIEREVGHSELVWQNDAIENTL